MGEDEETGDNEGWRRPGDYYSGSRAWKKDAVGQEKPKVLHEILGKPMILHVVEAAFELAGDKVVVVVGHQAEGVRRIVSERFLLRFAFQERQRHSPCRTSALPFLHRDARHVIVLCGDVCR